MEKDMDQDYHSPLQRARMARRWTVAYVAEQIGVQTSTVSRWENGHERPQASHLAALEKLYGMPAQELGLEEASLEQQKKDWKLSGAVVVAVKQDLLSRMYALIARAGVTYRELARLRWSITQELEGPPTMKDGLSRRETVRLLAILPILTFKLDAREAVELLAAPVEEILKHCTAGIAACEQLAKGDAADITLASSTLSHYLPTLKEIVVQSGRYRKQAATLVAQACMRKSLLMMHLSGGKAAVDYARQAVFYGKDSGDVPLYIATLVRLAYCYGSNKQYQQASEAAAQARAYGEKAGMQLSPLLRSDLYACSARYCALLSQKGEVPGLLARAQEHFTQDGNQDSPAYVDMSNDILALNEGEARYFNGQPAEALAALGKIIDLSSPVLPLRRPVSAQRIEIAIVNYAALSSLKLPYQQKDKNLSLALTSRGLDGAEALASRPRYEESDRAIDIMESLWPDDRDVIRLRERAIAIKTKLWGSGQKKAEE
jgi:DNA-binding XRE family transcriptional regulator